MASGDADMAGVPAGAASAGAARVRLCGVCRLPGHDLRRCPIVTSPDIFCGCNERTCGKCTAACGVCDETGHAADTLKEKVRAGIVPKWACPKHELEAMQTRLAVDLGQLSPTQWTQKEATRGHKRRLAALVPSDGARFRAHLDQSEVVDLTGLGGAAASPAVRLATAVATALQDEGVSRPAARTLGAFAADSAGRAAGGTSQAAAGPLGTVDLAARRSSVVAALDEQLKRQPQYSAATRGAMKRRQMEMGLNGGEGGGLDEALGLASPFFSVKGKELKRAAVRYVGLPDGSGDASKVKEALRAFIGPRKMNTGASVTNRTLTCEFVCDELMTCAANAGLQVFAVLASLRQFVVEMRAGDEAMS
ncbi:hypothetical protein I4F81_002709 [Pyropia yezoensis]|uniref:Uncharacterized protein n=2 Tax=Pyropia yezoensis TaxID=2788 RepID=A0ACC3BQ61_PYRYE|nr:hypothetical protein I4F81_002709 [Neopyropia yezoensis]